MVGILLVIRVGGAFRRRCEEITSRQDLDIGEAVSRGDFGDKLVQKLLQHLHYSVAVNNIFKVGGGGGGGGLLGKQWGKRSYPHKT